MKLNSVNFGENGLELFAKIPYNNVKLSAFTALKTIYSRLYLCISSKYKF